MTDCECLVDDALTCHETPFNCECACGCEECYEMLECACGGNCGCNN